ncbi:E3 ubiquitin-protein ligase Praja-2 isoform X1 [Brienomyrus brachyistius]|uniref:E3 ubiquitin-protein ligase Praja-2 isoform X1 n=2 Tax=Brienomyrus brachyistius TaxID=42636 RepID=UPI0020B24F4A|nr:E3 ubiquitin-protein ligase Praja-2 isoform X1 [Brienomyrus brachyistius]
MTVTDEVGVVYPESCCLLLKEKRYEGFQLVMGQEAGKSAWPKPAGGYQTITGRRYGRRHAYVSFRPTQARRQAELTDGPSSWQGMEMDPVPGGKPLTSKGSISSVLQAIFPVSPNSVHPEEDAKGDMFKMKRAGCGAPPCGRGGDCEPMLLPKLKEISDARGWPTPSEGDVCSSSVLSFVNTDPYKEHSSDGDEEAGSDLPLKELDKDFDQPNALHSTRQIPSWGGRGLSPRHGAFQRDAEFLCQDGPSFQGGISVDEDRDAWAVVLGDTEVCGFPVACDCDPETTPTEMVVRPKIRKQTDENPKERRIPPGGEAGCGSVPPKDSPENFLVYEPQTTGTKSGMWQRAEVDASGGTDEDEDDLWEDLEDYGDAHGAFRKGDDSSQCSEGELSASWTSASSAEKEPSSGNESWETLPGFESEPEGRSDGNSLDGVLELSLVSPDQSTLEEGELPWPPYHEGAASSSSSDEEADTPSRFVHPGLFMLDGNNNLEDDSSVSEDLDAEWRRLDDLGDGFGMAQAISFVDPQLLTYMALEERLAQAMEVALAHLESLAMDVEPAHPPASEDVIDCLPPITVMEDYHGKEQCCAICCSEYVKDEIVTELPCRHAFHRRCVTLWLQKSGTCPVCRHVLTPGPPAAPVQTSFVSDHEAPPSDHSTAGTR